MGLILKNNLYIKYRDKECGKELISNSLHYQKWDYQIQLHRHDWATITDGEPADIDKTKPQYPRFDTKKAVKELYSTGVLTYLTLDPHAGAYVKRIFGENNHIVIDDVNCLPERLSLLFSSLAA